MANTAVRSAVHLLLSVVGQAVFASAVFPAPAVAKIHFLEPVGAIALPGVNGGFDLMAADAPGQRLFLAAEENGSLEILDLNARTRLKSIGGMNEPKWVVYRPESHFLYVSNGDGKVRTFDSATYFPGRIFGFREKANNLRFDDATGELFVGIGKRFGALAIINTRTDTLGSEIPLANFPKQFELDGDRIYVNVPAANHIAVISRSQGKVIATWPVRAAKDNIPMGFDRASHRLFVGCESGKLAVFDTTNGREVTSLDINAEPDGVHYDAKRHLIYVSCGAGFIDVIRQQDADHYARIEQIPTAKGAATSLFVAELDRLYLAVPAQDATPAELRIFRLRAPSP